MHLIGEYGSDGLLLGLLKKIIRDTLNAARIARDVLWDDEKNIPLKDFVYVSQT
jgi:hypothetical protein